jgi:exodeoxyribonuclease VII small subunit
MNSESPARQFEELLAELQSTVARMESEPMTLQQAVDAYERSIDLASDCARILDEAELRISRIDARSGVVREQAAVYRVEQIDAARLLLGDEDDDLLDLLDDEFEDE